jgi:ABC-2 type transport system ATP-binding protein
MQPIISVRNLSKTYASGFQALKRINLEIRRGEIFALLGPNGAGKTTLINIICGIVNATKGVVLADGDDVVTAYRTTRSKIGLVPQELMINAFETVWATVSFSRGLLRRRRLTVPKKIIGEIEPIEGKRPGEDVTVSNTGYWMGSEVTIAKAIQGRVRAFGRVWDFDGRSGEVCQIDWKGPVA